MSSSQMNQNSIAGFLGRVSRAPLSSFGAAIGAAAITPSLIVMAPGAQAMENLASPTNFQPRVENTNYTIASARTAPFYERTFTKMDRSGDGSIEHAEIVDYMKSINIDGGFLGLVHSEGANAILENVDKNGSNSITKDEMMRIAGAIDGTEEFFNPQSAPEAFRTLDRNNDGKVTIAEMSAGIKSRLDDSVPFKSTIAESAGKMIVDIFDSNNDKTVDMNEMSQAANEAEAVRRNYR
ncbi:MAG: EF-hand domain-containing protein [Myxococcota bacterium]|nr:EF-hand domain-containing protein [Myxococcota bacterium]